MAQLLIMIGLPGSGKSTLAAQFVSCCKFSHEGRKEDAACSCFQNIPGRFIDGLALGYGWTLISTDRIRAQLYGDEAIQGDWFQVWKGVQRELRSLAQHPHGKALYDATNVVRRQRRQLISLARSWGYERVTALWLDVPLEVCLERNQRRSRQVPIDVIHRMHRRLEGGSPSLEEGLDELIRVGFTSTEWT